MDKVDSNRQMFANRFRSFSIVVVEANRLSLKVYRI